MCTVQEVLSHKGSQVHTIDRRAKVLEALTRLADHDIGALLVVDEDDRVVGILSERDYARKVILLGQSSRDLPVERIMTEEVICVSPDHDVEDCMRIMTEHRVRHLPVIRDGALAGVISIGDVVKVLISEKQDLIEHLEAYIRFGH